MAKITRNNGPSDATVYVAWADELTQPEPEPEPFPVAEVVDVADPATLTRPTQYAPKGDWVDYVKALTGADDVALAGTTKHDLASLTDTELVELYGGS